MQTQPTPRRQRGEKTRAQIVKVATRLFAERGYSDTRLEDVASQVGVQRAALVYYFRNKSDLYETVISESTDDLVERFEAIFASEDSAQTRIETLIGAWVDIIAERPWLTRLMLREIAGATPEREPRFANHARRMLGITEGLLAEGRHSGAFSPIDALHLASAVAGATVFFVSAMPTIAPRGSFDPLSPGRLGQHRSELLAITRRLLGVRAEPARKSEPEEQQPT